MENKPRNNYNRNKNRNKSKPNSQQDGRPNSQGSSQPNAQPSAAKPGNKPQNQNHNPQSAAPKAGQGNQPRQNNRNSHQNHHRRPNQPRTSKVSMPAVQELGEAAVVSGALEISAGPEMQMPPRFSGQPRQGRTTSQRSRGGSSSHQTSSYKDKLPEAAFYPPIFEDTEVYNDGYDSFLGKDFSDTPSALPQSPKTGDPDLSAFDFDSPAPQPASPDDENRVEVVGVRFKQAGKVYYFAPGDIIAKKGDYAIVETARGVEFGEVWLPNTRVPEREIVLPLRPLLRLATPEDIQHNEDNRRREREAFAVCAEKILKHGLDMKLVDAQYTFDNTKLLFYFTSAGRVDFRELVKDLASVFRTRIELRQIGIRDEAKLLGGLGACGRSLCCSSFLSDFTQVSIKMAKEQNLSLNSNKISGACGRLMCCLRYEYDTYVEEIRQTPPVDSMVRTPDGDGIVIEMSPLAGTVKVRLNEKQDTPPKTYHRNDIKILSRPQNSEQDKENKN